MKLKKALKTLKKYCMTAQECDGCPFMHDYGCYWTAGIAPEDWKIKRIVTDVQMLRGVKDE